MRGRYRYSDFAGRAEDLSSPQPNLSEVERPAEVSAEQLAEDVNAAINAAKQNAGHGPRVFRSPETPAGAEDVRAIVRAVALKVLRSEIDYHGVDELAEDYYPELKGITAEQINAVILEDLS